MKSGHKIFPNYYKNLVLLLCAFDRGSHFIYSATYKSDNLLTKLLKVLTRNVGSMTTKLQLLKVLTRNSSEGFLHVMF